MHRYIVTGRWQNIHSDFVLGLTDQQAAKFEKSLEPKGKGTYLVKQPIQIPKGESFGYEGDIIAVNCKRVGTWTGSEQASPAPVSSSAVPPLAGGNDSIENSNLNPPAGGNNESSEDIEKLHWTKIKEMVLEKGGEFINKAQGVEFLKSLNNGG